MLVIASSHFSAPRLKWDRFFVLGFGCSAIVWFGTRLHVTAWKSSVQGSGSSSAPSVEQGSGAVLLLAVYSRCAVVLYASSAIDFGLRSWYPWMIDVECRIHSSVGRWL